MKKYLLSLAFAVLVAVPASAQLQWGIMAGTNLSKVSFSSDMKNNLNNLKSSNMSGWYVGPKVKVTIPVVGLGLDASLQYSQKKLQAETDNGSESMTFRSVEIPINLRYNFGLGSVAAVYVATGPQFGFNVGNKKWDIDTLLSPGSSMTDNFKKSNMNTSWNIGAGVKLLGHLEAGILYNIALSKYYEAAGSSDYNFKSNSWQLQVAYLF